MRDTNGALSLGKYSIGVGDRFALEAEAQLKACVLALRDSREVIPVWNKSNREHLTIGSEPATTRQAADTAVKALGWSGPYHVDADHIGLETVGRFLPHCDFYTIDVAEWIGKPASAAAIHAFVARHAELTERITIPGLEEPFHISPDEMERISRKYLLAIEKAGAIYRRIQQARGKEAFITEVSLDETDCAQTPVELLIILAALADERIPAQTMAPKFTGRFNKGVDYSGDVAQFEKEFNADLAVIRFAVREYGLPENLKLSIHSGSDKFSIYPAMRSALERFGAGLHLKTAGTTWLEEVIGLAEADGSGLAIAREIYLEAFKQIEALCAPYASVIDIDQAKLPSAVEVQSWSSEQFVAALRHGPAPGEGTPPTGTGAYNPHFRQLIHIGYKLGAKMGNRYLDAVKSRHQIVAKNVTHNLYERHLRPLFLGELHEPGKRQSVI